MLKNNQTLYFTVCINYALMLNKSTLSNLITNPSQFQQLTVSLTVSGSCSWSASGPAGGQLSQKRIIYSSVLLSVTLLRVAALPDMSLCLLSMVLYLTWASPHALAVLCRPEVSCLWSQCTYAPPHPVSISAPWRPPPSHGWKLCTLWPLPSNAKDIIEEGPLHSSRDSFIFFWYGFLPGFYQKHI